MLKRNKPDVKVETLIEWDQYAGVAPDAALSHIYQHARGMSKQARDWYWRSIGSKRRASLALRTASFTLLAGGAVLPVLAGFMSAVQDRLTSTQIGVAALAVAGLLYQADRVFGWSSGWLRYIGTVTAMEDATRRFELDWSGHMIGLTGAPGEGDKLKLFELARTFEQAIMKLRSDETDKWVAEFNSGLALLQDLIKTQRESAEQSADSARTAATARSDARNAGAIELTLVHAGAPEPVTVLVDQGGAETFTGTVWSKLNVPPGLRTVQVATTTTPARAIRKIADVPAGGVARLEIKLS
jgi:hypothetical protein